MKTETQKPLKSTVRLLMSRVIDTPSHENPIPIESTNKDKHN
jgi:hypothetical protein